MKRSKNQIQAYLRNRVKGNLFAINNLLTPHHYQPYLYPDEQAALARIVVEVRTLMYNWKPKLPGKGESKCQTS